MAEIGLDSRRNGLDEQARSLDWQVRSAFAGGAAGTFVFSWTDEWHRGGFEIDDWDFGLTDRARRPKPALAAISRAYAEVPFPPDRAWPRISVVVCSYNGARTIRDCLDGLARIDYPDVEVIVVNDGSTDATPNIAAEYDVTLINQENRGLSAARNRGLEAATGEIVAYIDDDARPDPDWLRYLAATMVDGGFAAAGGPNIAPPGDGWIADCVANSPGGPVQVLLTDLIAEHVPGCNMAFRRDRIAAIGGFDPIFRTAGDDVDACWRIQAAGGEIGFSPAAVVWHHRRNSVRTYWKQQQGYGRAEALLERKWPEKYNALGHVAWAGRLYGKGLTAALGRGGRLYGGTWGLAAYQSVYEPGHGLASLALMPEWYLFIAVLAGLSLLGLTWAPLLLAAPLLLLAVAAPILQAALSARRAVFTSESASAGDRARLRLLTFAMHLLQPAARLRGRIRHGLSVWRLRAGSSSFAFPAPRRTTRWTETWQAHDARLVEVEAHLKDAGGAVLRGGDFDRWDLELRSGILGSARLLTAIEEHGAGRQLERASIWPHVSGLALAVTVATAVLGIFAWRDGATLPAIVLLVVALALTLRALLEMGLAVGGVSAALADRVGEVAA
jgi:GT2 family glycosyltransferase